MSDTFHVRYDHTLNRMQINLPAQIRKLVMYDLVAHFESALPTQLRTLRVGTLGTGKLKDFTSLRSLTVDYLNDQSLPSSLRKYNMQNAFDSHITSYFSHRLKYLIVYNLPRPCILLNTLHTLELDECHYVFPCLPKYLRSLHIGKYMLNTPLPKLPKMLKILNLYDYNLSHLILPSFLKHLELHDYTHALSLHYVHTLRHLELHAWSGKKIYIGSMLKTLILHQYDEPLKTLSDRLKMLIIPNIQHRLPTLLPSRLSIVVMKH